jgi:hypothetical protein
MPRELSNERCEMEFEDRISNCTITFYYRIPDTDERVAYASEQIVRKGNKVENKTGETRLKYGLKILTGFKKGDFTVARKPFAWDPADPDYNPAWKTLVKAFASDLLAALAVMVFEVSAVAKQPEEEAPPAGEEGEDGAPAAGAEAVRQDP